MEDQFTNEPMLEMYLFETSQLIEQLEQAIMSSEKESSFSQDAINVIFRIMHTIKGSSAMMMFHSISTLAHTLEDIFYFLREEKPNNVDCSTLSDFVLEGVDFIKVEAEKIRNGDSPDGNASTLLEELEHFLLLLKKENGIIEKKGKVKKAQKENEPQQYYIAQEKKDEKNYTHAYRGSIFFEDGCEMENLRAYTIVHNLKDLSNECYYYPDDIISNEDSAEVIKEKGFELFIQIDYNYEQMHQFLMQSSFLKSMELQEITVEEYHLNMKAPEEVEETTIKMPAVLVKKEKETKEKETKEKETIQSGQAQSIISVSVAKLDKLMDLVGEMVISEAMVTQNPDLFGLDLSNFQKAAQQLNKITSELQDTVMSIRMVPLAPTFMKMNRIVRDMCKQLGKDVELNIIGEETEVDKNIIEHISDPLMHLVRNSIDHGIEATQDRISVGKVAKGHLTLEAKNSGSDVLIIVKDDGKGLDKEKILKKAMEADLLFRNPQDMSEREIFHLILLPGFSTKESVSEFSGRGVGMDVVSKNIEEIGGTLSIDSLPGQGTTITLKIPLTLAIIDGMKLKVGNSCYTIPIISIKESLRPLKKDLICDPDGNEMLMVRGQCFSIIRLHEFFGVETQVTEFSNGIMIIVETDDRTVCIFGDELLGQQQVVVKSLPAYIQKIRKIDGLTGCTLLGDGSISLILDIGGIISHNR